MPIAELIHWWNQSSEMDREYGRNAYPTYRYDISILPVIRPRWSNIVWQERFCAAFALLSPNSAYEDNLRNLALVVEGFLRCTPADELHGITTFPECVLRAYQVLSGQPIDLVFSPTANKTRNFYHNILEPANRGWVTIDGHMHNLWRGCGPRRLSKSGFSPNVYDLIALDFFDVAKAVNESPCALQATLWWAWKRVNRIRFNPQLPLPLFFADMTAASDSEL